MKTYPKCKGAGWVPCPKCNGKGETDVGGFFTIKMRPCRLCGGDGSKCCGVCHGRGRIA